MSCGTECALLQCANSVQRTKSLENNNEQELCSRFVFGPEDLISLVLYRA